MEILPKQMGAEPRCIYVNGEEVQVKDGIATLVIEIPIFALLNRPRGGPSQYIIRIPSCDDPHSNQYQMKMDWNGWALLRFHRGRWRYERGGPWRLPGDA